MYMRMWFSNKQIIINDSLMIITSSITFFPKITDTHAHIGAHILAYMVFLKMMDHDGDNRWIFQVHFEMIWGNVS